MRIVRGSIALFAATLWAMDPSAAEVLDVDLPADLYTGLAIEDTQYLGQTFTSTIEGRLSRIELPLYRNGGGADFTVGIYPVVGTPQLGHPDTSQPAVFSQTYSLLLLPLSDPGTPAIFTSFDVSSAEIDVLPGDRIGIFVSRASGATDDVQEWILWSNADLPPPSYDYSAGGSSDYRRLSDQWTVHASDLSLRTFVTTVPESGTGLLVTAGLLGLAARRRLSA